MDIKEIHNKRKIDRRKKFDTTKNFFKQFINSHANFKTYEFEKKNLKNVKKREVIPTPPL